MNRAFICAKFCAQIGGTAVADLRNGFCFRPGSRSVRADYLDTPERFNRTETPDNGGALDILVIPIASDTVTTAGVLGSPPPRAIFPRAAYQVRFPRSTPHGHAGADIKQQQSIVFPRLLSRFCRGVGSFLTSPSMLAILPISVAMPVVPTTARPFPDVTIAGVNAFVRAGFAHGHRFAGQHDSSQAIAFLSIKTPSAPTRSPVLSTITSPTTSSADEHTSTPSRSTRVCGIRAVDSRAYSVLCSAQCREAHLQIL